MIRTFEALRAVEPGFAAPESLQTFRIGIAAAARCPICAAVWRLQNAIVDAIEAIPGVESAAFTNALPMEQVGRELGRHRRRRRREQPAARDGAARVQLDVAGLPRHDGHVARRRPRSRVGPTSTRLRPVALVSETLARELWQTPEAALGKRIRGDGSAVRGAKIVGVVADVRMNGLDAASPATVYWPTFMAEFYPVVPLYVERGVAFAVRSPLAGSPALDAADRAGRLVRECRACRSRAVRTMQDIYDRSLGRTSFTLVMLVAAAAAALVLGVVGLVRRVVVRGVDAPARDRDSVRARRASARRAAAHRSPRRRARRHRRRRSVSSRQPA